MDSLQPPLNGGSDITQGQPLRSAMSLFRIAGVSGSLQQPYLAHRLDFVAGLY